VATEATLPAERKWGAQAPKLPAVTVWEQVYGERAVFDAVGEQVGTMRELVGEVEQPRVWHPLTITWWRDVWRSPVHGEFARVDLHRLYLLADLVDRYWRAPSIALATEIRLQEARFGLDPMARRSLQWEIPAVEPKQRGAMARQAEELSPELDPRRVLYAV